MSPTAHATVLRIDAKHPALPGHFPGQPIMPGVVLLDCVLQEAERWLQRPVRVLALPNAKFTAPLLPDETAELRMKLEAQELRFSLSRDGAAIAQGLFRIAAANQTDRDGWGQDKPVHDRPVHDRPVPDRPLHDRNGAA